MRRRRRKEAHVWPPVPSVLERHSKSAVRLTPGERKVIVGLFEGLPNKLIAKKYGLSEQTVKNRLSVVFEKYSVSGRLELVLLLSRERRQPHG